MRHDRAIGTAILLALGLALSGCESVNNLMDKAQDSMADFNPFGTAKRPLQGDRQPVFPAGVPGVQQGVPPELIRGNPAAEPQPEPPPVQAAPPPKKKTATVKTKTRVKTQTQPAPAAEPVQPSEDSVWPPPPRR